MSLEAIGPKSGRRDGHVGPVFNHKPVPQQAETFLVCSTKGGCPVACDRATAEMASKKGALVTNQLGLPAVF